MSKKSLQPRLPKDEQERRSRDRFLNLILQGIIAANQHHDPKATPEVRLSRAREALLGEKPKKGRTSFQEDVELFPILAEALKSDSDKVLRGIVSSQAPEKQEEFRQELARPPKSLRSVAMAVAAELRTLGNSADSAIDRLRKAPGNNLVTPHDMAELEGLYHGNSGKAKLLDRILKNMELLGIQCERPGWRKLPTLNPKQD